MLRAVILLAVAHLIVIATVTEIALAQRQSEREDEHRFTALETKVEQIAADVRELNQRAQWEWLKSVGLAGLVGEAGLRTLRRRKDEEPEG